MSSRQSVVNQDTGRKAQKAPYIQRTYTARMPTERYASEYNMQNKRRGRALIFNHEFFDRPALLRRNGTNEDCRQLTETLQSLHFDVTSYKDAKYKNLKIYVENAASQDHSDSDCILIAILTHGEENGYLYAKDESYNLETIADYLTPDRCPSLAGKPKIFLIQACRGGSFDPGVTLTEGSSSSPFKIPLYADFLYAYSTIPGFVSWRKGGEGSWFIRAVVNELKKHGTTYDMLTLLTFVNQSVAIACESNVPDDPIKDQKKQIPCFTSMLTRMLRFTVKNSED